MQQFGGGWTEEKLERVSKYLAAYTRILGNTNYRFAYIDAFAGTGYRELRRADDSSLMFPELAEADSQRFLEGSARIALRVEPPFHKYIFIEQNEARCAQLEALKIDYPGKAQHIKIVQTECNDYLQKICLTRDWQNHRAVLFLDPFGMQVQWETVEAIAGTQAIDLWLLFPLGVAVNRLLKRDGEIDPKLRSRLDNFFGTQTWFDAFYDAKETHGLFENYRSVEKVAGFHEIGDFFIERLQTVFDRVATNPFPLYNSRNNPLYLLCFAAGNPKGAPTAVKIAEHILGG